MTSFSYWPSFSVLAEFFLYWPSLFCIGRVCHQYDASRFCDTNAILMRLINNESYYFLCVQLTIEKFYQNMFISMQIVPNNLFKRFLEIPEHTKAPEHTNYQ